MRGLDRIATMRRRGFTPLHVTFEPECKSTVDLETWVQYGPRDMPEFVDLRPLVGLIVVVMGDDEGLTTRWASSASKAGAKTVATMRISEPKTSRNLRIEGVDQ